MRKKLLPLLLIPVLVPAQFAVVDVASIAKIVEETRQIVNVYTQVAQTYNQIAYNAGWTAVRTPWLGVSTPIVNSNTASLFGETTPWNGAVNQGLNIPGAYGQATYAMTPAPFYSAYPIGGSLMSANMASVEIADGANPAAIQTIADSRGNQPMNDMALANLESSAQDTSQNTNSEVEQSNQISSSTVLTNRQLEDLNAVVTTQAEQSIVANKIERDNLADAINLYAQFDMTVASQPIAWGGDPASTITNW
jgi:hypothetical protein